MDPLDQHTLHPGKNQRRSRPECVPCRRLVVVPKVGELWPIDEIYQCHQVGCFRQISDGVICQECATTSNRCISCGVHLS